MQRGRRRLHRCDGRADQGDRRPAAPGAGPARRDAHRPRHHRHRPVPHGRRQDLQRRHRRWRGACQAARQARRGDRRLVANQADSTTGRIERAAEIVNTALETRSKAVIEHLGQTGQTVARAMSSQLQEAQSALVSAPATGWTAPAARSCESLDRQINEAETVLVSANERLAETGRAVESTLRNQIETVEGDLASAGERFVRHRRRRGAQRRRQIDRIDAAVDRRQPDALAPSGDKLVGRPATASSARSTARPCRGRRALPQDRREVGESVAAQIALIDASTCADGEAGPRHARARNWWWSQQPDRRCHAAAAARPADVSSATSTARPARWRR